MLKRSRQTSQRITPACDSALFFEEKPTFLSSWSQTASLAASDAEWEAEAFAPDAPRLALMSSSGFFLENCRARRRKAGASRKPSR